MPLFDRLCWLLALLGGLALLVLAGVTVISVLGRYFFAAPIWGDVEIVSLLTGAAVSLFLPYCQLRKGNVIVDVFTNGAPRPVRAALDAAGSLALAVVAGLLAWRLGLGALELRAYGEETMLLRWPVWWGFVPVAPSFALLAAAGVVSCWRELRGEDPA